MEFQKTVEKAAGNQHLQFTPEIWMNNTNMTHYAKKNNVKMATNNKWSFLDMKMIWSHEEYLKFLVFRKIGTAIEV